MPEFNWNVELPLECYSNIPVAINNDYEFYRNDQVKQKYLRVLLHFIKKPGFTKNACYKFLCIVYFANIYSILVNNNFTKILLNIMANMFCFIPITFEITTGLTSFKGQCCILVPTPTSL